MDTMEKLTILADSAKYDVACTSSGVDRADAKSKGGMGSAVACGICHTFSADGRCVSLLKVLLTNICAYDCSYCVNRRSNDVPRAAFTPRELADLTIGFYRRNYIEGLFLSSAVLISPDHTTQLMIKALELLRFEYGFRGYIHAKAIPGTDPLLLQQLGTLADRMSVNIELPSAESLGRLAPDKTKDAILKPMGQITRGIAQNSRELVQYRHAPKFVPAGQSTQMIVGASPESDHRILQLTEGLYRKYELKRVFFSAYVPVVESTLLPSTDTKPPLLREHRLYQADWLLRFYHFSADEILSEAAPNFNPYLDPKCNWAIHNMHLFPIEVSTADYEMLLRVPGIGPKSAKRIVACRRGAPLSFEGLKKMGVVLKRAQYFILCRGQTLAGLHFSPESTVRALVDPTAFTLGVEQTSMFDVPDQTRLNAEEAVKWLAQAM
ncbi:MAG: putative DNA modification/repair radical SAM protein [Oscillospiraceae bacterium]|nr:putative DNA modification/repair radical SAM protein [Oscillospiraceae bacterium]